MPDDTIRVWTIQRPGWYALLQQRGVLGGDGRRPWRELRPAYRWLMGQMRRRIPGYRGGWPVWFWCTWPDLGRTAHLPKGERGVCFDPELFSAWVMSSTAS